MQIVVSLLLRGKLCRRKTPTLSLAIVCFTLIVALALVRNDLCEVEYRNGTALFKAVLAYEVRD
ncbi:Hok/Gef family protein [Shewanella septentrionalis]|uniref:Hok/Gef family protein n=1 Tax=Shewanella septentrionalis TaxID=2952223 RepID=A0A9X3AVY3_9GAMM|nr:Hok/Gef family protein [Shewanella septentrionalis]MCT7947701.1 Hok/Gef family protein [Shewanella septentrionalis]